MQKVDVDQFVQHGGILIAQKLRTALRPIPGALIWLHRTRLDIGFDIAKIATDSVQACGDVEAELETSMHSL